jgi:hypothetical protein
MNTKLLGLLAAATLATAACSQEKKTEETTTVTTPDASTTTTTTTTVDTAAYRSDADALAARVAADLKVADTTVVNKVKRVYYTRGRKLRDYSTQYATDTTGRYAALKAANDETTASLKSVLSEPQYQSYAGTQGTYYEGPYTVIVAAPAKPSLTERVGQGSGVKKMEREDDGDKKTKFENGGKIKREDDGSLKIKRADGTKVKIDENGKRTVKKPLF